jgi:Glycosyl hydrolase 36 superfamily, catalytic domain/Glycosyltransferase family 36
VTAVLHGRARRGALAALLCALALVVLAGAPAAGPAPLSGQRERVDISSRYGSGVFGRWFVDRFGLPAYRYRIDEERDPRARRPELSEVADPTDAWSQLGNDHVVANAYNHGYTQLWSQDRVYQWVNRYSAEDGQYAGGFGYLRTNGRTISTLYADRPAGARTSRAFGAGYSARTLAVAGLTVGEHVYAPFGDDPVLLHDVTIRNRTRSRRRVSWFEYWGVNPWEPAGGRQRGLGVPSYDGRRRILSVTHAAEERDGRPLRVFAAALRGRVNGHASNGDRFFGGGGRATPAAVAADRLDPAPAPAVPAGTAGRTLLAFRTPVVLGPGRSVTLRYAYGAARPAAIPAIVRRWRSAERPLARSQRRWREWLPQASLGSRRGWLSRELQWAAYTLRSGTTFEQCARRHVISQGGYYQYGSFGSQIAYRDPLQHMLPLVYAEPRIARDVLVYSAQQQPSAGGQIAYGTRSLCRPAEELEPSNDMDLWLLWSAAEYGLATRDLGLFDRRVRFRGGGAASLWHHLKLAYQHQESLRGRHGGYRNTASGDWSDFSGALLGMTESTLVSAQLAFVYPRLAELAAARGDRAFARRLHQRGRQLERSQRAQWTGRWFTRGYGGDRRIGTGAIFGEPQPWNVLAGVPGRRQARTLVAAIRRFLTGVGAPAKLRGPARIGSSMSPAAADPGVTERVGGPGIGGGNAVFVGGAWYAVNGWLTWALGELEGVVANAGRYALDELERNTLAAHAAAFPERWNGVLSVDDACHAWFAEDPASCGIGLDPSYAGQIMHQPAWTLYSLTRLAGIVPTARGYRFRPRLPLRRFSVRLPRVGLELRPGSVRGYLRPSAGGALRVEVARPGRGRPAAWVAGRRVRSSTRGGLVRFRVPTRAGRATDFAVTARRVSGSGQ